LSLTPDDAHLWRASLDMTAARVTLLERTLSFDERERATRYRFAHDRARYIVARGILRTILGRYLDLDPAGLRFVYGPQGKPVLTPEHGASEDTFSFNLSHAGDVALYAVTRGRRVGVDVERVVPDVASSTVPEHTFSPHEVAVLRALPLDEQTAAFFRCWTRKEAYVKALGAGFSLDLTSFDVSLAPGDPPALLATRLDPTEAARWSLHDVDAGPGYVAVLVVEGHDLRLTYRDWAAP